MQDAFCCVLADISTYKAVPLLGLLGLLGLLW
jgi:hypothetical protein